MLVKHGTEILMGCLHVYICRSGRAVRCPAHQVFVDTHTDRAQVVMKQGLGKGVRVWVVAASLVTQIGSLCSR